MNWISVDDKLPTSANDVLCSDGHIVWLGWYSQDRDGYGDWYRSVRGDPYTVTHWMPMPEPPVCSI